MIQDFRLMKTNFRDGKGKKLRRYQAAWTRSRILRINLLIKNKHQKTAAFDWYPTVQRLLVIQFTIRPARCGPNSCLTILTRATVFTQVTQSYLSLLNLVKTYPNLLNLVKNWSQQSIDFLKNGHWRHALGKRTCGRAGKRQNSIALNCSTPSACKKTMRAKKLHGQA